MMRKANKAWHGVRVNHPDWRDDSHSIAFTVELREGLVVHIILNAYWEPLDFELPPVVEGIGGRWRRWIDTALDSPHDIVPWQDAPSLAVQSYRAEARSVVVLFAARS